MSRRRQRKSERHLSSRTFPAKQAKPDQPSAEAPKWPLDVSRMLIAWGVVLLALCTAIIYAQTVHVPPIDYDDSFYLTNSPYVYVSSPFSRLGAVWNEPYFANFHPVTTTTWLLDRELSDKSLPFDELPFRVSHLIYATIGALLLIPLYRRLGLPTLLALMGALVYAVHPIHTEVLAWLSARKDLMALIFVVLSMLAWLWAREAATPNQWRLRHLLTILLVLLAVLSKPIAVILPALFAAFEFCSGPHASIARWRGANHRDHPLVTRALGLTAILVLAGGLSAAIFRGMLQQDPLHGGWLILVPIGLSLAMMAAAPKPSDFLQEETTGMRVFGPPFAILSVVAGAGSAWTFWAQGQVGAIKGGTTLLATLNLTCDAILAYFGRALIPARMSVSHTWATFPSVSVRGLLGAALLCLVVWIGVRFAGSVDRNRRLMAFGIFWFLIALIPVSNLVPTSTKMADRYLFLPTIGAILGILALAATWCSGSRRRQLTTCAGFVLVIAVFAAWSHARAKVWCGNTTLWHDRPQPDLSLWTSAVETDPEDTLALTNLGATYLRLDPPDVDQALANLNQALQLSEANQSKNAGGKRLTLTHIYQGLGDAYLAQASSLTAALPGQGDWQKRKEAYLSSVKYYNLTFLAPSGFATLDVRILSRLSEAYEGLAQMETVELGALAGDARAVLQRERDSLRTESEQAQHQARELLATANLSPMDADYRMVVLQQGNALFNREIGASNEEKDGYYQQALVHYQEAASLFPNDPRPFLYEGLCYERMAAIEQSAEDKQQQFLLGELALRKAMTLQTTSSDYNPSMPLRVLASLYLHMGDYRGALDSLQKARQAGPTNADAAIIDKDIQSIQGYLRMKNEKN
jgi:tetratricopeptide (TPR) repeat protein